MQRTLALLGALLVVGGGLGLYAYYGVMKTDEAETARKEVQDRLFAAHQAGEKGVDGGAPPQPVFTKIVVKAKGQTTVLEKKPGAEWAITSPVQASADKLAVDGLVSQLQTAKFKDQIEEAPDEAALAKYGLKDPQFSISAEAYVPDESGGGVDDPARRREVALLGGIENTFDGSVYLQRQGQKPVYSAQGGVRWALEKSTYDLRDKELFSFEEPKLTAIEVKSRLNAYSLERDAQKAWKLSYSPPAPAARLTLAADAQVIAAMLSALKSERALAFPADDPEARRALGLEAPVADATLTLESGEKVRLRFGSAGPAGGEKTYVLREGPGKAVSLAEVNASAATQLDKNPGDLKDRSVLAFKREEVARLSFTLPGGVEATVQKKVPEDAGAAEEWEILAPEKGPAKKWKLSSVLWMLGTLKAAQAGEENPKNWAKYGIDAKARQVALADNDGKELARLVIGGEVPDKPGSVYARGSKPQVVEVDASRFADLPQTLADLLDKPAPPTTDAGEAP